MEPRSVWTREIVSSSLTFLTVPWCASMIGEKPNRDSCERSVFGIARTVVARQEWVRLPPRTQIGEVAQSVEHWPEEPGVVGSIPTFTTIPL